MFTDSPISFIVKTAFGKAAKLVAGGGKRASRPSGNLILGQIEADNRIREFPAAKKERRNRQTFQIHSRLDPAALATYIYFSYCLSAINNINEQVGHYSKITFPKHWVAHVWILFIVATIATG
jgi:hypothetical protein